MTAHDAVRESGVTTARRTINLALLALLAWLLLHVIASCLTISPEFDGAMNLLESRSIAEGHGPRAIYDSNDPFPYGVQTKEPYVLLGALVFKLAGVGPFQIELPNLLYLLALCTVVFFALRRMFDTTTALLACALLLAYPRLPQYGLRGYGEIPTLFFGFASLALIAWPGDFSRRLKRRCLWAGVCAGLAIATKVVGIAQMATVGALLLCRLAFESPGSRRDQVLAAAMFGVGVLVPLSLVEAWRLAWLGGAGYRAWWVYEWASIGSQSGVTSGPAQVALGEQVTRRFLLLCQELRFRPLTMGLTLVAPAVGVIACFAALDREQRRRCRWLLAGMLLLGAMYFAWWLAIVPEAKAWVRYIYIALVDMAFLAAIAIVAGLGAIASRPRAPRQWLAGGLGLLVLLTYAPITARVARHLPSFDPDPETINTTAAARFLSGLPKDAVLLGYGWYGAPSIQIYVAKPFMDLSDYAVGRLTGKPAYLIADRPTLVTGMLDRTLARYPHRALRPENDFAQVYAMDFAHPLDPFTASTSATKAFAAFAKDDYPATYGMEPYDPIGGRFIESDSEILLRYEGQDSLRLVGYMDAASPSHYRWPPRMEGQVIIGDCPPLRFVFNTPGWRTFLLPLNCRLPSGHDVRVRILLDNVLDLPMLKDRQRAMLLNSIGFVDASAAQDMAPAPG